MDITLDDEYLVQAWMLFPDKSDEYRQQWVDIKSAGLDLRNYTLMADIKRNLSIEEVRLQRVNEGLTVGAENALLFFDIDDNASTNKSRDMMRDNGGALAVSNSTFKSYRNRYKPVMHLWGAYMSMAKAGDFELELPKLLFGADEFRLFNTRRKAKGSHIFIQDAQNIINFRLTDN